MGVFFSFGGLDMGEGGKGGGLGYVFDESRKVGGVFVFAVGDK